MRRHRQEIGPLTEINVTNLLDTCFVLLMAFMVVAPAIQQGLGLQLPTVEGKQLDSDTKKTLTVAITKGFEGGTPRIMVEEQYLTPEALQQRVEQDKAKHPTLDVIMEVDKAVPFQTFAEALASIKQAGVNDIGILTVPPEDEEQK